MLPTAIHLHYSLSHVHTSWFELVLLRAQAQLTVVPLTPAEHLPLLATNERGVTTTCDLADAIDAVEAAAAIDEDW